ncbi:16S rRNA (uracil(1498)-N(3))-methyltransferase [Xenophilus arseniciresistens]|uniref:Ribosomal RNA small subunit methyltransferase E n=1 Tax=Xenophilus arseniciresistens TaxID=1283306 RepID=A0AAE3NF98_9BURK|nr:16S rRNA (uracil(1498)-N(3))-methyltransferase [Xenophilus arseniciresistens]MDA7419217.1 16S rRNA (uracil(1498)-N(3))-methyltransferase [Xenophilus arseniciresistens]
MPRIHCAEPLASGQSLALPAGAARHVQVLRLQPGDALTLFDGRGGEYAATVQRMGRSDVHVQIGAHDPVEREAAVAVHLAIGMPANERMDWLVEKAVEMGVASIQPLVTAHGVLRLAGERAQKKQAHWQAVAVAACEQCGRNRVPELHPVQPLAGWLESLGAEAASQRLLLAFAPDAQGLAQRRQGAAFTVLGGPEGGLNAQEEAAARARGFVPVTLGPRVLRAETAQLVALASLTLA